MVGISTTLVHGLLICIPFSAFVLITFIFHPRLWLHSLPSDIQQLAARKTEKERRQTRYLLLPVYLFILPGLSVISTLYVAQSSNIDLTFIDAFAHIYGIWVIVHVWDFAIIDLGYMLFLDPDDPPILGTEGAEGWKDVSFHFRSLLRAVPMSLIFVLPAAAVISFAI